MSGFSETKKVTKHFLYFALFFIFLENSAVAFQFDWLTDIRGKNTGHTTCLFLTLPNSADLLATGQASSNGSMDATDIPVFTANTALADRYKLSLTHLEWFMGLRKEYIGALFPILDVGTVGAYTQMFTPGKISYARDIDENPSSPSMLEYSLGATFARQFLDKKLNLGIGISYLESHLDDNIARGIFGGFDFLFCPYTFINARLYIANISNGISYNHEPQDLPMSAGCVLQFAPLSKAFEDKTHINLTADIGTKKIADQPVLLGLNSQVKLWNIFSIKAGYDYSYGSDFSAEGLGVGAGLQLKKCGVSGAWRYESKDLGSVWSATVNMQFEELLPKTAEDYYAIAMKHYKKGRFGMSAIYAKKALALDPNMWKAHALLSNITSEILREKNLEIGLIYTGNNLGKFVNPSSPGQLGGLARQATAIRTLQNQFPVSLTIEAGNLVAKSSQATRNSIAGKFLDESNFDIVACGNEEVDLGLEKYQKELAMQKSPRFFCRNYLGPQTLIIDKSEIRKKNYSFFVTSIINNSLCDSVSKIGPIDGFKVLPQSAENANLRILIIHDTWDHISKNPDLLDKADIAILGSMDHPFQAPMKIGHTLILSAGKDGEYVGNLIMRFDEHKKLISAENKLIPMTDAIAPDPGIEQKLNGMVQSVNSNDTSLITMELSNPENRGVFPFFSDRNGSNQVFLKIMDQKAEFPLSEVSKQVSAAAISYAASKVALVTETDTCSGYQIKNLTGAEDPTSTENLNVREMYMSSDNKWVYFSASPCGGKFTDLYKQRISGGTYLSITKSDSSNEKDIAFSPKENLMAFCSDKGGTYQIYLSDLDGTNPIQITSAKADHFSPSFSSDGRIIAYLSDRSNFGGKLDLWIYDMKQKEHRQITRHSNIKEFCWANDSRTLIYSSGITNFDIYKTDIESYRFSKLIPRDTSITFNERSPFAIRYNNEMKILYTREYEDGTKKIYWVNQDGSGDQCVVNSAKNDWLTNYRK